MAYNAELLASFERERRSLEGRISELIQLGECRRTEIERLKIENRELSATAEELELLRHENRVMRDRLAEHNITIEHFTDAEKLSLLQSRNADDPDSGGAVGGQESSKNHRSASEGGESSRDGDLAMSGGSLDANWDRGSEGALTFGSGSEISVACLQDRLQAMEETQYSTSEELAATLQELGDLQSMLNSLSHENERLADERTILLESLCSQTEKLENSRRQVQHLKALLLRDGDAGERSENERQLVALVHCAEEEREELLLKQAELLNKLESFEAANQELHEAATSFREQLATTSTEKHSLEVQLNEATQKASHDATDLVRSLMETPANPITDSSGVVQNADAATTVSEGCLQCGQLRALLSNARDEQTSLNNVCSQLRSQVKLMEDRMAECRNEMTTEMDRQIHAAERVAEEARCSADAVRASSARLIEEQHATINRLESELRVARKHAADAECAITEISARFEAERRDWEMFQRDLQTAVVVANDVRNEAQSDAERLVAENRLAHEREAALRRELDAVKAEAVRLRTAQRISDSDTSLASSSSGADIRDRVMSSFDRELSMFRHGRRGSDLCLSPSISTGTVGQPSLSVRRLISSIEEQVKSSPPATSDTGNPLRRSDITPATPFDSNPRSAGLSRHYSSPFEPSPGTTVEDKPVVMRRFVSQSPGDQSLKRHTVDGGTKLGPDDGKTSVDNGGSKDALDSNGTGRKPLAGILSNKSSMRRKTSLGDVDEFSMMLGSHVSKMADPLGPLAKQLAVQNATLCSSGVKIARLHTRELT